MTTKTITFEWLIWRGQWVPQRVEAHGAVTLSPWVDMAGCYMLQCADQDGRLRTFTPVRHVRVA